MLDVALRFLTLTAGWVLQPLHTPIAQVLGPGLQCQPGCSLGLMWQQDQVGTAQGRADTASPELAAVT